MKTILISTRLSILFLIKKVFANCSKIDLGTSKIFNLIVHKVKINF